MGGVAHESVEKGPCGTEDVGWGAERGLFDGAICLLSLFCCFRVGVCVCVCVLAIYFMICT